MNQAAILVAVASLLAVTHGFRPNCNNGPSYWCLNAVTAEECGREEFCAIMEIEKNGGKIKQKVEQFHPSAPALPVNVSLYYESLCPGCRNMIKTQIYPTYQKLKSSGILNVMLYPYGNAHEKQVGQQWNFQCQHGEEECQMNLVETCALHLLSPTQKLPYIHCVETKPSLETGKLCAEMLDIEWAPIEKCYKGPEGNLLEHQMAVKTDALNPKHNYVPWFTVNGVHTDDIQNKMMANMLNYVCSVYKGVKPAACTRAGRKQKPRRRVNACYKD